MNPTQGEVVPMATTSIPNEEAQQKSILVHKKKKEIPILSYKDMTDESVNLVLDIYLRI